MAIQPETLDKLRKFDTPTICNLIELFDVRPRDVGFMDDRIKACFPEMPPSGIRKKKSRVSLYIEKRGEPDGKRKAMISITRMIAFQLLRKEGMVKFKRLSEEFKIEQLSYQLN